MLVHDGTKKTKSSCYINHFTYQYYMQVHDETIKQSHHVISIILYINTTCWFMMELKNKVIMLYQSFYISILHAGS